MKKLKILPSLMLFVMIVFIACSTTESDTEIVDQDNPDTDYDISSILSKFEGTGLSYATNGNTVTFTTQDLPNHTSPYWPTSNALYEGYNGTNSSWNQNPNEIGSQNISLTISLLPYF